MTRITTLLVLLAACASGPLTASAAVITVPTGLNPGDHYRLAFVTSTTRDATSADIADYNAFVADAANAAPELLALGTTWTAIASTATVDARDNTGTNPNISVGVAIYGLDDLRIADDNADLWDGDIDHPIVSNQYGNSSPGLSYVGTFDDGVMSANPLGSPTPTAGRSDLTDSHWVDDSLIPFLEDHPLYALSGELTVVPEPGTMFLMCFGATGVVIWQLRIRRHRKLP
jgi:PEP-CTERM motif